MFKKSEISQNTVLQIKQDDKFFCRLLTKESSMSNPSFRDAPLTVPFVWESQPGTPKYTFSENTLPPLTPPPSYYSNTSSCKKQLKIKRSRSNLFLALLPKLINLKRITIPSSSTTTSSSPSSFSSPSWSSSSDSSSSKVVQVGKIGRRRFLSFGSSFDFKGDDHKDEDGGDVGSPTSTLCFGIPRSTSNKAKMEFPGYSRR